jgi:hypothetical protein
MTAFLALPLSLGRFLITIVPSTVPFTARRRERRQDVDLSLAKCLPPDTLAVVAGVRTYTWVVCKLMRTAPIRWQKRGELGLQQTRRVIHATAKE